MTYSVRIMPNDKGTPSGKLADAVLHFHDGPLKDTALHGFAVWQRRSGTGRNVTMPSRTYSVNGERRVFALLRPDGGNPSMEGVRDLILAAYADYEAQADARATLAAAPANQQPDPLIPRHIEEARIAERMKTDAPLLAATFADAL